MKKLFKMVVNVEKLLKMVIFQNLSKHGEMLKNVGENIKKIFALIFFYTMDIKNTIFNPKFYQHVLPSLLIKLSSEFFCLIRLWVMSWKRGFNYWSDIWSNAIYFGLNHRPSSGVMEHNWTWKFNKLCCFYIGKSN